MDILEGLSRIHESKSTLPWIFLKCYSTLNVNFGLVGAKALTLEIKLIKSPYTLRPHGPHKIQIYFLVDIV